MAEERNPQEPEEQVEDLDTSEEESDDVKGGALISNYTKLDTALGDGSVRPQTPSINFDKI